MEKCNVHNCDIYGAINLIKSRYASVVLFAINENKLTFSQLLAEFDYLSPVQLTRTLNQLEQNNLIKHYNKSYSLTNAGKELIPILNTLEDWHDKHY